ncbi:HepT-like ribonuclease domain-containing protein [Isoptericola croceus]|uniref:HepT-like ribonuclease domain-containing protein n=1 Tax=Isoptericola croceus TaxID=3031406 RepID=UPI0023FA459F|nr:HepT-like ribonuclease domain-containing protein [Isoptericola croceus]
MRQHLDDAMTHLEALNAHASRSDVSDEIVVDACALRLSAAIDAVSQVPATIRAAHIDDAEWRAIRGMRNRIAHADAIVDPAVVRQSIAEDVSSHILRFV